MPLTGGALSLVDVEGASPSVHTHAAPVPVDEVTLFSHAFNCLALLNMVSVSWSFGPPTIAVVAAVAPVPSGAAGIPSSATEKPCIGKLQGSVMVADSLVPGWFAVHPAPRRKHGPH